MHWWGNALASSTNECTGVLTECTCVLTEYTVVLTNCTGVPTECTGGVMHWRLVQMNALVC